MLTGGRIMHHLKDFLPDPTCTLLFIGYQGEGTLGPPHPGRRQDGAHRRAGDRRSAAACGSISGFSAHADQHELEAWLAPLRTRRCRRRAPKSVFIVHGDPDAAEAFAARVRDMGLEPHIAQHRETVDLA